MTDAKEIFDFISERGEGLFGKAHVIYTGQEMGDREFNPEEEEYRARIYHADGFCFDIERRFPNDDDDIRDVEEGFVYSFNSFFEGFQEIDAANALRILKRTYAIYGKYKSH